MCTLYAGEKCKGTIFKDLIFLIRDWEVDEDPKDLKQRVNKILKKLTIDRKCTSNCQK